MIQHLLSNTGHTGQQSAMLASITDAVNGKFTGIDNWEYFRESEEKSKSLIKANLDFLNIQNYNIITADCNKPIFIEADFHFWDVCRSNTPHKLVDSIHSIIDHNSNKKFMICVDDCVEEHPFGNKEFIEIWKEQFHVLKNIDVILITENKLFLSNHNIDHKLTQVLDLLKEEQILPYSAYNQFYDSKKYLGNLFGKKVVDDWSSRLLSDDIFWNKLLEIFKD